MHPLEAHFHSKKQPKVTQNEIQSVWWLGGDERFLRWGIAAQQAMCGLVCYHTDNVSSSNHWRESHEWIHKRCQLLVPTSTMVILRSHWISCCTFSVISSVQEFKELFDCPTQLTLYVLSNFFQLITSRNNRLKELYIFHLKNVFFNPQFSPN
jgi:hypothetical protein